MSHTLKVKVEVKDETALATAAGRMGATVLGQGTHHLFAGDVRGFGVKLEGWQYPTVFNLVTGECSYDTYGGRWGDQAQLDRLVHEYTTEVIAQSLAVQGIGYYRQDAMVDGAQQTVLCLAD